MDYIHKNIANIPIHPTSVALTDGTEIRTNGLTLRLHFAGLAMQAIIAKAPFVAEPDNYEVYQKTAVGALIYADAMIAELVKEEGA